MDVRTFVVELMQAYQDKDEERFNDMLFDKPVTKHPAKASNIRPIIEKCLEGSEEQWVDFLSNHIIFTLKKAKKFPRMNESFQAFLQIFERENVPEWMVHTVVYYAKLLFREGIESKKLDDLFKSLRKLIVICQRMTRGKEYRAEGLYASFILYIKVMFRMNALQNYTTVLRVAENEHSELPTLDNYPTSQQVEFKYYQGRYYLYNLEIDEAYNNLEFAFARCANSSRRNKRIILQYLIPVKIMNLEFPKRELLLKYDLEDLWNVIQTIQRGDLNTYEQTLHDNAKLYFKQGLYMVMDHLKIVVYRNFFKKVSDILKQAQVPLKKYQEAFECTGRTVSIPEIECMLCLLIQRGWVKGYIASGAQKLVLSKTNPFPIN